MIHEGQGLALGFEAGNHLPRIHTGFEDLQRDGAADRLPLLGHEDYAKAALADLFDELVRADLSAWGVGVWMAQRRFFGHYPAEEVTGFLMGPDQPFDARAQLAVAAASLVE